MLMIARHSASDRNAISVYGRACWLKSICAGDCSIGGSAQADHHNAAPKWRLPRSILELFFGAIAIMIVLMTKWHFAAALAAGLIATTVSPIFASISAARVLPDGMQFTIGTGVLRIQMWTDDVVRVTYATGDEVPAIRSLTVVATPTKVSWKEEQNDRSFTIILPRLRVRVDKESGAVGFADVDDHLLLSETAQGRAIVSATEPGVSGNSSAQSFQLQADEGVYGLGQHQQGLWNYRSGATQGNTVTVRLAQANTEVAIPVIASSKGYMLLWDNPAVTSISLDPKAMRWSSDFGRAIDYYFCYGDGTTRGAMKAYRHLTGDAPLMPRWMLGFWQCKERYSSQQELLEVAKNLRDLKVPVDGIIQDWQYWPPGDNTWGSHRFDPARYPDPVAMFRQLHSEHYHTLISVWAKFDLGSANSRELNANGGMFPQVTKYAYPPGQGQWYDPFAVKGREIYWRQIRDQLFAKGVDGWWLDAPEPEIFDMAFRGYTTPLGPGYTVYNAFPLMHSTGIYKGQRAATNEKRVVILTRSAYAGQQRNSAITWSGDIQGNWSVFRNQIPAGLNFSLSGIPYWNTDTGGFFADELTGNGDPNSPLFVDLFSRWFQFSAVLPHVPGSQLFRTGSRP